MKKGQKTAKATGTTVLTDEVQTAVITADAPESKEESVAKTSKKTLKTTEVSAKNETESPEPEKTETKKPAQKSAAKKTASKAARKEVQPVIESKVIIQQNGYELEPKVILERAKADWFSKGHEETELKSIELYIKPEEWAAYYVVNGEMGPENKVSLD